MKQSPLKKPTFFTPKSFLFMLLILTACFGPEVGAKSESTDFYGELSRLNKVLSEISRKYVEDVDAKDLTDAAVDGVRHILDPHTVVFDPKDYGDLKVQTEGEFGGLGITIAIREKVLTVITPLVGTPAFNMGLLAGDRIVKIEGKSTAGITIDEAVGKLRGKVGTDVTITVDREGEPEALDFTITRGRIVLKSVPYSGMLQGDIGYIKVTQFSQKTSNDIKAAIKHLKKRGMKKLVFDLRFNPGGLLKQAIEVSEIFLEKGNAIVSTKGRTQHSETKASIDGILPKDIPVAVLINEGSASASEIVSGALQDWDRAVILGKTSFGKGSVQTILPLTSEGHALKLTTAFYYLPMGRCINKPENEVQGNGHDEADSTADSTAKEEIYKTNNGRSMFGGGGITPDIEVEVRPVSWYGQVLERQSQFFKFVVKERPNLEAKGVKIDEGLQISDETLSKFKTFISKDTNVTKIETSAEATVTLLDTILLKEQELTGDTSGTLNNAELKLAIDELRKALEKDRQGQFDKNTDYIKRALKREFLTAVKGEEARIAYTLTFDKQVEEAVKLLQDSKKYNEILAPKK